MTITGVRNFYYMTNNLEEAKKFYIEALGFELDYEQPGWTALKMNGIQVGLHPTEDMVHKVPSDGYGPQGGGCLTLNSDNIPEDRKKLEEFGAKILGENDESWGHLLTFEDPDGNVLNLMNPKY